MGRAEALENEALGFLGRPPKSIGSQLSIDSFVVATPHGRRVPEEIDLIFRISENLQESTHAPVFNERSREQLPMRGGGVLEADPAYLSLARTNSESAMSSLNSYSSRDSVTVPIAFDRMILRRTL